MRLLLDAGDAVGPVELLRVQVPVREGHEPPAHGEEQPAADEGGGEDDEREAPLEVHERGEHVLQEAALLADVLVRQVARAVLGDEARLVHAVSEHRFAGHAGDESRQTELLRDDALPRQHVDAGGQKASKPLLAPFVKSVLSASLRADTTCPNASGESRCEQRARRLRSAPLRTGTVSSLLLT